MRTPIPCNHTTADLPAPGKPHVQGECFFCWQAANKPKFRNFYIMADDPTPEGGAAVPKTFRQIRQTAPPANGCGCANGKRTIH